MRSSETIDFTQYFSESIFLTLYMYGSAVYKKKIRSEKLVVLILFTCKKMQKYFSIIPGKGMKRAILVPIN